MKRLDKPFLFDIHYSCCWGLYWEFNFCMRSHGGEDYGKMKVEDFVKIIKEKTKI